MNMHLEKFLADPALRYPQPLADAFALLDHAADSDTQALEVLDVLSWIAAQPRTIPERLDCMRKLLALLPNGKVHIPSMREFCGWAAP